MEGKKSRQTENFRSQTKSQL